MLERMIYNEEPAPGVSTVYDAALTRARSDTTDAASAEGAREPRPSLPALQLVVAEGGALAPFAAADWSRTIALVERAAATIKAYERRFVQLDIHTRALIDRAAEEQARLREEVLTLETRVRDSEERAARAELAVRDEAFYRWEAERRLREMEGRLTQTEDHLNQSEDYLRRVHTVLAEL